MENKFRNLLIPSSEITPEVLYRSRREFFKTVGVLTGAALLAACSPGTEAPTGAAPTLPVDLPAGLTDELGNPANAWDEITNYNNYYEFTTNKEGVAQLAEGFNTRPWTIEVSGLVNNPKTFAIEDLLKLEQKERVYRLRCVEAWSMVIPWRGFELGELLSQIEPQGSAKYVKFTAVHRPDEMPGQDSPFYPWPYGEGLRLDEAMHPLTLLATGLYGEDLPKQNGAPLRLVVPWKYGFKSIKAITRIELTEEMPHTLWSAIAPGEYGFYANVNPEVSHPRWSQASERRIGETGRRDTLPFNGYAEEVAGLYADMDLNIYY